MGDRDCYNRWIRRYLSGHGRRPRCRCGAHARRDRAHWRAHCNGGELLRRGEGRRGAGCTKPAARSHRSDAGPGFASTTRRVERSDGPQTRAIWPRRGRPRDERYNGQVSRPSLCSPSSSTIDRPCPEGRPGSKSYASHLRAEKFTPHAAMWLARVTDVDVASAAQDVDSRTETMSRWLRVGQPSSLGGSNARQ